MTIGLKIAEGREAEVYEWDSDAVVKLYRPGYPGHATEAAVLSALQHDGVAPALNGHLDIGGRHGLIMERLHGTDMLTLLQQTPWRLPQLARTLAAAHLAVNRVQAPAGIPDLRQILATHIEEGVKQKALRDFALRVLDQLPDGDRLCHGDLHPGNVLVAPGRTGVIDWPAATRGAPAGDYARTLLLLRQADPPPGTPLLFRGLMAAGRSGFARTYAQAYRKHSPDPLGQVHAWTVVNAAARLAMGIEVEEPKLTSILRDSQRKMAH